MSDVDDMIDLSVITGEKIKIVCADICGGKCCKMAGSDFQVPVSVSDFARLREVNVEENIDWGGKFPSLQTKKDGSCVFLDDNNLCSIYNNRPKACSIYPFKHLKPEIEEFCLLYHHSPKEYRDSKREEKQQQVESTGSMLFDHPQDDPISVLYLDRLNNS